MNRVDNIRPLAILVIGIFYAGLIRSFVKLSEESMKTAVLILAGLLYAAYRNGEENQPFLSNMRQKMPFRRPPSLQQKVCRIGNRIIDGAGIFSTALIERLSIEMASLEEMLNRQLR